jgi:ankyrin repeat protein
MMNTIDRELIAAAGENNLADVLRLVGAGADVNVKDDILGWTPLHEASYKGHLHVVIALLDHGADIEVKDNNGWTPLHHAVIEGHLAVVNELPSRGADIEAQEDSGNTPLHLAGLKGHVAIVKALLSGGANILAVSNNGHLPIHYAVGKGNSAVAKYLLQECYATTRRLPLHELVEDLTWVGNPDSSGVPPLRFALHRNVLGTDDVVEMVEYLDGRNPKLLSSRDQDGSLLIHVACRRGASFPIVESLANLYKASVKSVTSQGDLPLFLACEMPETSLGTIFLLLKLYPDVIYR